MHLLQNVTSTVNEVCKRLKKEQQEKNYSATNLASDSAGTNGEVQPGKIMSYSCDFEQ